MAQIFSADFAVFVKKIPEIRAKIPEICGKTLKKEAFNATFSKKRTLRVPQIDKKSGHAKSL
jgi:hypothetical protein